MQCGNLARLSISKRLDRYAPGGLPAAVWRRPQFFRARPARPGRHMSASMEPRRLMELASKKLIKSTKPHTCEGRCRLNRRVPRHQRLGDPESDFPAAAKLCCLAKGCLRMDASVPWWMTEGATTLSDWVRGRGCAYAEHIRK